MAPVSLLVVGAGGRGSRYAEYAIERPDLARIVGVAEPRPVHRERIAEKHDLAVENTVTDWREFAARPRFADAVIIATQDAMHIEPAIAFAELGYHILLEKPMAPNEEDCRRIAEAAKRNGVMLAICHVLRYTPYTEQLKAVLKSGRIGDIVSIQHLEPVGYWHQAHSFVRGNWRNEAESSSMLLAKSCHDLDWIRYIMDKRCVEVSSFGSLKHFRADQKPEGAADRCLDCPIEQQCAYSAKRLYLRQVQEGRYGWPVDVLTPENSEESVLEALRTGPYGRCVYSCDNDVVDHQVVNMRFEDDSTASFTMTAFTAMRQRETQIFGTKGEIRGNSETIEIFDFLTETKEVIDTTKQRAEGALSGHGGGDAGIMASFVEAVANNDPSRIRSGPRESLETHLMVFAAERARREGRVVKVEL